MIPTELRASLLAGLNDGGIVPYLGPGMLADVRNAATGAPIPATSDELILAMRRQAFRRRMAQAGTWQTG
jgi:hypothetical protein